MILPWYRRADRPLLAVAPAGRREAVLGAFQRAKSALGPLPPSLSPTRRQSGGPALLLAPSSVHLCLALPHPRALVDDADVPRLVNRHVRPLLRALTRLGAQAHYFGRDFVTASQRPVAWVGFAHHASSGSCLFEAFVGLDEPFSLPEGLDAYPARSSPPWLGKPPVSLSEAARKPLSAEQVIEAIVEAYDRAWGRPIERATPSPDELRPICEDDRPRWASLVEETIGFVGASRDDRPALGGDLLGSVDLLEAIDEELSSLQQGAGEPEIEAAIERAFERVPAGVIEGVREARSLIRAAMEASQARGAV